MTKEMKFCYNCKFRHISTFFLPCSNYFIKILLYSEWKKKEVVKNEN